MFNFKQMFPLPPETRCSQTPPRSAPAIVWCGDQPTSSFEASAPLPPRCSPTSSLFGPAAGSCFASELSSRFLRRPCWGIGWTSGSTWPSSSPRARQTHMPASGTVQHRPPRSPDSHRPHSRACNPPQYGLSVRG